jgi:hypothetical protein
LGHFGRSQFYIALKLIAAAQAGLPLTAETFASGLTIPLPQLSFINEPVLVSHNHCSARQSTDEINESNSRHGSFSHQLPGHLPPPPTKAKILSTRQRNNKGVNNHDVSNRQLVGTMSPNHIVSLNNNHIQQSQSMHNKSHVIIEDRNARVA